MGTVTTRITDYYRTKKTKTPMNIANLLVPHQSFVRFATGVGTGVRSAQYIAMADTPVSTNSTLITRTS